MIIFTVEHHPQNLVPGETVRGILTVALDRPYAVSSIELRLVCEEVTRRLETTGSGEDSTTHTRTDRNYLMDNSQRLFASNDSADTLPAGQWKYSFEFHLPEVLPGSLIGPVLSSSFFGDVKLKYEVNYWFEPKLNEKVASCFFGKSDKSESQKLLFSVYEKPDLRNYPIEFRARPWETKAATEVSQGCFEKPGEINFTFRTHKLHATAGNGFPISVELDNQCKSPITKLTLSLIQNLHYYVLGYEKNKISMLGKWKFDTNIQPGTFLTVDAGVDVPATIPASTPTAFYRKITIRYALEVKVTVGSHSKVNLITPRILVSNLPFAEGSAVPTQVEPFYCLSLPGA